jgi:hypothetical protein
MFYAVVCKTGHVGRNNYIQTTFVVGADSRKDAAAKARLIGSVKHHDPKAIISINPITKEEADEIYAANKDDLYWKTKGMSKSSKMALYGDRIKIDHEPAVVIKPRVKNKKKLKLQKILESELDEQIRSME